MKNALALIVVGLAALAFALPLYARGFRRFSPIASPNMRLPKGAEPVKESVPIPDAAAADAVRQVMANWGAEDLEDNLDEQFYDKQRLLDNLAADVPRDAVVRVLSVQNIRPLQQYITPAATPQDNPTLSTIVSVTAHTQIEYNDPETGFQKLPGTNDFILRIDMVPAR